MFVAHVGISSLLMLPFIAPILALLGMALMFPTRIYFTSVNRRSLDLSSCASNASRLSLASCTFDRFASHVQDSLQAILESEECVQRIVCNINNLIEEIRFSSRYDLPAFKDDQEGGVGRDCQKLRCYFLPLLRDLFNLLLGLLKTQEEGGQEPSGLLVGNMHKNTKH